MDNVNFSSDDHLKVKFYRSEDYDLMLEEIRKEFENPLGLFKDVYIQNKERNPNFLGLTLSGIERKQQKVYSKWLQVDFSDSQMTLEGQIKNDPDFRFYEELKDFIRELQKPNEESESFHPQKPKGKPILTREQTTILFYYLREKLLIAPNPQNQHLATAIEMLTGYSSKQIADILTRPERPVYHLGKDQSGVKKDDLIKVKNQLQNIIERISKDLEVHKEELK